MNQYISLLSVVHSLKERTFWSFCAALSTHEPLPVGPNLRLLPDCVPRVLRSSVPPTNHPQPA